VEYYLGPRPGKSVKSLLLFEVPDLKSLPPGWSWSSSWVPLLESWLKIKERKKNELGEIWAKR